MYAFDSFDSDVRRLYNELEAELGMAVRVLGATVHTDAGWNGFMGNNPAHSAVGDTDPGITIAFARGRGETDRNVHHYVNDQSFYVRPLSEALLDQCVDELTVTNDAGEEVLFAGIIGPGQVVVPVVDMSYISNRTDVTELVIEAVRQSLDGSGVIDIDEHRAARARAALERYASTLNNTQMETARATIDSNVRQISELRSTIARMFAEVTRQQQLLDALLHLNATTDPAQRVIEQFEQVRQHPKCASITIVGTSMVIVTTDDLRMTRPDNGESRWIGQFTVKIGLTDRSFHITNNSTPRGGREHPHVLDHRPCFGGHQDDMYELLGNGELFVVFDLLVQYLETLNLSDEWGRYGSYWFDVEDQRPLVSESFEDFLSEVVGPEAEVLVAA